MSGLSRRNFLSQGSLTVVAAGVVGAMPAVTTVTTAATPEADAAVDDGAALEGPLVAHVTDLQRGLISLYSGEQEVQIYDKALAAKLFNAVK
jgi:hypothetical protein